jgi:hypothetical protein
MEDHNRSKFTRLLKNKEDSAPVASTREEKKLFGSAKSSRGCPCSCRLPEDSLEGRRKKEEGRRKKEEGRRKKEEEGRKKEERGRREGKRKKGGGRRAYLHPKRR